MNINITMFMNTKTLINIQRKFLLKCVTRSFEPCKSLIDYLNTFLNLDSGLLLNEEFKNYLGKKYDHVTYIIKDKEIIKLVESMISKLNRFHNMPQNIVPNENKLSAQTFMIAWLIASFPEFTIEVSRNDLNREKNEDTYPADIYFIACDFIKNFNLLMVKNTSSEQCRKFKKSMNQYCNAINYFLNRDKIDNIKKLIREWLEMTETMTLIKRSNRYPDEEEKKKCFFEVAKTRNKVMKYLSILAPNISEINLKIFASLMARVSQKIILDEMNKLTEDIKTKNFILLKNILNEIKDNIIKLAKSLKSELNEHFDVEFIIASLISFNKDDINKYGDYLVSIINTLEAPISVGTTNDKWHKLKNNIIGMDIDEYLMRIIFFVLEEITSIKENIINIHTMMSVGIDPLTIA